MRAPSVKPILLLLLILAGLGLWLVGYFRPSAPPPAPEYGAPTNLLASPLPGTASRPVPTGDAALPAPATSATNNLLIPLIDPANPAYTTALALMDRRFLFALTGRQPAPERTDPTLLALARSLSVAHLSKAMYEATLAEVVTGDRKVTLTIPPYPREGASLERYVRDELLADFADQERKEQVLGGFRPWGYSQQTLIITPTDLRDPYDGAPVHQIEHRWELPNGLGPASTLSTLSVRYLGPYTAFAGWFPK